VQPRPNEGESATGLATGYPQKGLYRAAGDSLRDNIGSNDRGWSQWGPSARDDEPHRERLLFRQPKRQLPTGEWPVATTRLRFFCRGDKTMGGVVVP